MEDRPVDTPEYQRTVFHPGRDEKKTGLVEDMLFVFQPALLGQFSGPPSVAIMSIVAAILAMITVEILLFNYYLTKISLPEAVLNAISWIGFVGYIYTMGNLWALVVGVVCFTLVTLSQWRKRKKASTASTVTASD